MTSGIPFRIRIGVTGHRQLTDEATLAEKISHVLQKELFDLFDEESTQLINTSPHTPCAFSILTPLAEGADRLVAKEVLKLPDSRIEVVLPLAKEDYLQDFVSLESKKEFEELLSLARRPMTLQPRSLNNRFPEGDLKASRRQAYEDVGRYIVHHCDLLIALYDSASSRGKGGAAEIVDYARKRKRPMIIISTVPPYAISVEKGHGLDAGSISRIESFNALNVPDMEQRDYVENMYAQLFDNEEGIELPEDAKRLVKEQLLPFYTRASLIAKGNQTYYLRAGSLVYTLSTVAIACVAIGILLHRLSPYAFFAEFLLLATVLSVVIHADRRKSHRKWIESRFLAERIRSSVFFAVCGLEASSIEVPSHMRAAHRSGDWMVKTFDEIWNRLPAMKGCHGGACRPCREYIRKHWIQDQMNFHKSKAAKAKRMSHGLERIGIATFAVAMIVALSHFMMSYLDGEEHASPIDTLLTFLAIVLPAAGATLGGIRTHREYSRLEKNSENMESVLADMDDQIANIDTPEALESLLRGTDELMLRETQEWLMVMRFVELKPAA